MPALIAASAAAWAALVLVNYLVIHGFAAEFGIPAVYIRQWIAALPPAGAGLSALLASVRAAAAAAAVLLAGAAAGASLARWLSGKSRAGALDRLALGAGLLALAVLGLALAGLANPALISILVLAGVAWSAPRLRHARLPHPAVNPLLAAALAALAACLLAQDLLAALAPEWYYDALLYHLAIPDRMLADRKFTLLEGHMQFSFPLNPEMLYAAAMALGGETAAKLANLGLWILALGAIGRLGRELSPGAGALAAILFYAQPMMGPETESAFAESGWTLWIALAAVHAAGRRPDAGLAAAFAGLAAGAKYIALLQAIPLVLVLAPRLRRRALLAAVLLASLVAAPWYAKNWLFQVDPFFPALAPWGVSFGYTDDKLALKKLEVSDYGLPVASNPALFLRLPWDFVQHDLEGRYWQETSGPLLLILAPVAALALAARRDAVALRLAFLAAAWAAIWAFSNQWNRLLLPALAPATAVIAWSIATTGDGRARRALLALVLGWAGWCNLMRMDHRAAVERYYELNAATTGRLSRADWQARHLPTGEILPGLRLVLPPRARVLLVYEQIAYGVPARCVWESVQSRALLARIASEAESVAEMRKRLRQRGVTHILISRHGQKKAHDWSQYAGIPMRGEGLLRTFAQTIEPPDLVAGGLSLYALPAAPNAARTRAASRR